MPLRCVDPAGASVHAFDLMDEQWRALEDDNRRARHLSMPCCGARVVLKCSHLGTRFFAHRAVDACAAASETEEHLHLKRMAVDAARADGWAADTEVTGATPDGDPWRADVLARKDGRQVAVEIQWSGQVDGETLRRQERYKRSGVRGLWLLRQPGFPITPELPAVCIGGTLDRGFSALIPDVEFLAARDCSNPERWRHVMPMSTFLRAVFGGRFRFGRPRCSEATVAVHTGSGTCWHPSCQASTTIVVEVVVTCGPLEYSLSIPELGEYPDLLQSVVDRLPSDQTIGAIKRRYSRTQGRSYMSNGCVRCDRLFGEFHTYEFADAPDLAAVFRTPLSDRWRQAIESRPEYEPSVPSWYVVAPGG